MRFFLPIGPLLRGWLFSFLGWGAFFVALSWQMIHAISIPWADVLRMVGRDALGWAMLTPLIFRLVNRLPIERERWKISAPVHLAVCLAVVSGFAWMGHTFGPIHGGGPPPPPSGQDSRKPPMLPPSRGWSLGWLLFGPQLPIYLALVSGAHAFYFYRRSQEKDRRSLELAASLAEARLHALRMQIQPHFLFNSLNALAALIHQDAEAADSMLVALSDFLRLTLEGTGAQEVPLRKELEFVEKYLGIEKVRFGDRLAYTVDVSSEVLFALVPALILQPLVENAVRHGIEPRTERGTISIRAWRENETLRLVVGDDGVGIVLSPREGVGLANTRARLRELYGDAGTIELKSDVTTQVEVRIPFHMAG